MAKKFLRPIPTPPKKEPIIFIGSTDVRNRFVTFAEAGTVPPRAIDTSLPETYLLLTEDSDPITAENGDNLEHQPQ